MVKTWALSEAGLRALKPKEKTCQVFDGDGLYLEVKPDGRKLWRFQKRISGKIVRRSLGKYPLVSLKEARIVVSVHGQV
ncbi:MAG: Arm DNA-binding domain-containing protein [Deltaproteobacteria bacterium]|jgi:hypothetical protein|nr:Arm DNA-binding domain-containing protein [Deltaproteobacteria bacterium]